MSNDVTIRTLSTDTIERAYTILSDTRIAAPTIEGNLLADAFLDALMNDSDAVMLGLVEMEALESTLDRTAGDTRAFVLTLCSTFETLA